jgi:stage V sporulation protein S
MEILFSNLENVEEEGVQEPEQEDVLQPEPGDVLEPEPRDVLQPEPGDVLQPELEDVLQPEPGKVLQPEPREVLQPEPEREPVVPTETRPSILKVSARSRPSAVAGAIAGVVREKGRAEVQSIGAGATNQAVKAIAIARSYLEEDGIDVVCIPSFVEVIIEREERTAIRLVVEQRN